MKRTINSPTGFSPVEKEKRITSPTMHQTSSQSSLISTTSSVRRELDRALAFEKPPNGQMRDRIVVDILKIDENDFKGTISPLEAKNLIYINTLGPGHQFQRTSCHHALSKRTNQLWHNLWERRFCFWERLPAVEGHFWEEKFVASEFKVTTGITSISI